MVQWLGLRTSTAWGTGSIPGRGITSHKPRGAAKINKIKKKKRNGSDVMGLLSKSKGDFDL